MIVGLLGLVAFVLLLFTFGAVAERNSAKAVKFGAAFVMCGALIIALGSPPQMTNEDCWIDWDARSNATVCD